MRRFTIIASLIASLAAVAAIAPVASASPTAVNRQIALKGSVSFPNATGSAQYQAQGTQRELQVEVEHIRVLAGKHVNVFVNGNKWASPRVSSLGKIDVDRNTERGQKVPVIKAGSTVRVRTLGGTLIARGTF
jgi:hypothetical protein